MQVHTDRRPELGIMKALKLLEKMLRRNEERALTGILRIQIKKRNHSRCSRLRISLGEEPVEELLLSRTILRVFIPYLSLSASLKKHLPHKNLPLHREAIIKRKDLPQVGMSRQEELLTLSVFRPIIRFELLDRNKHKRTFHIFMNFIYVQCFLFLYL